MGDRKWLRQRARRGATAAAIFALCAGLPVSPAAAAGTAQAHRHPVNTTLRVQGYRAVVQPALRHRSRQRALVGGVVVAAAAGAALWLTQHQSTTSSTHPVTLPSTYGAVHMVGYLEGGAQPQDAQQLQFVAKHDSVVIAQPKRMGRIAAQLKSMNPAVILIQYENGMFSTRSDPPGMPESWFLHDSSGQRVHSAQHPRNALMNPLSTASFTSGGATYHGWADYVAQECRHDQLPQTSGCYLDMLGLAPLNPGYDAGGITPVDPQTGQPFSPTTYMSESLRVAAAVRSAVGPGKLVLANGYLNGPAYTTATRALNGHVNAGQAQAWMGANAQALSESDWATDVQMLISSGRAGTAMMARYRCNCSGPSVAPQRDFALGSYLLGNTGRAFFDFEFNIRGADRATKEFQAPASVYNLDLGHPLQTSTSLSSYLRSGVYQRRYSKGLVMVNPSGLPVPVSVSGSYRNLAGRPVHRVTLAPHTAEILTT
jgi:hypothetical protein